VHVLLLQQDVYKLVGGGQTVYRQLIERNPTIHFYYFAKDESVDTKRPVNAHLLPHRDDIVDWPKVMHMQDLEPPIFTLAGMYEVCKLLQDARGMRFDVVDTPDFAPYSYLIRPALEHFGIQYGKIALGMHGTCSVGARFNWEEPEPDVPAHLGDYWAFIGADVRYAISQGYAREWNEIAAHPVNCIDPLQFVPPERRTPVPFGNESVPESPVSLTFFGRPERLKGPDIFVDILGQLPRELGVHGFIIGPDCASKSHKSIHTLLSNMARERGVSLSVLRTMRPNEMRRHLETRTIVVLPSRYDTFNLTALEAVLSGCPVAIGKGAKIIEYLRARFPSVPFVEIDPDNPTLCISQLEEIIRNYEQYRMAKLQALAGCSMDVSDTALVDVYAKPSCNSFESIRFIRDWFSKALDLVKHKPPQLPKNTRAFDYLCIAHLPEIKEAEILHKLGIVQAASSELKMDRVRLWRELARLERMRGNSLLWATYHVRCIRALGYDRFEILTEIAEVLRSHQFTREAVALLAMYGPEHLRAERCRVLLETSKSLYSTLPEFSFQTIEDRRPRKVHKVAVIVSMYNAASKLECFLNNLAKQTLLQKGEVEIILVDSGSPTNEYEVLKGRTDNLPLLYARSHHRETIQSAWNRGISLARAEYLCFLGVDETLTPNALERLAQELDTDPQVDWVIGDSVVVTTDTRGNIMEEGMRYRRAGYHQDLAYLDTCYLSWVGALYRRSLHSRFGYYDPSFRGAGDTEFKGRVMPFIKSKALPELLGVFLNYPEERATESPMAELEDIRAWYLHRSEGGAEYAFGGRSNDEIAEQITRCLSYRKSYKEDLSTDFEYAATLLRLLARRAPHHPFVALQAGVERVLAEMRGFDHVEKLSAQSIQHANDTLFRTVVDVDAHHREILGLSSLPYRVFNDNRFEQHYWPWKVKTGEFLNRVGLRYSWN
jgi:glycosyltransferase involved in cell wall biosynthesis